MAEQVLLLRLEGPMQSWGVRARWDVRDTGPEPTKSGVIGLLGCALGLRRFDLELERLDQVLHFAVRIDRPGIVLTDYHTVTGYPRTAQGTFKASGNKYPKSLESAMQFPEYTIVSPRDYLHDAAFLVALTVNPSHRGENQALLELLARHLCAPRWPLYLGRKACVPVRPIFERLTGEYPDSETALRREPWIAPPSRRLSSPPPQLHAWLEADDGEAERQDALRVDRRRFFGFRRCRRIDISRDELIRRET